MRHTKRHTKEIETTGIRPERVYDPADVNADETGHVWVISVSQEPDTDKLYLCTDGSIR
jgi:hypothetical protein